jgi:hypothetical protein
VGARPPRRLRSRRSINNWCAGERDPDRNARGASRMRRCTGLTEPVHRRRRACDTSRATTQDGLRAPTLVAAPPVSLASLSSEDIKPATRWLVVPEVLPGLEIVFEGTRVAIVEFGVCFCRVRVRPKRCLGTSCASHVSRSSTVHAPPGSIRSVGLLARVKLLERRAHSHSECSNPQAYKCCSNSLRERPFSVRR